MPLESLKPGPACLNRSANPAETMDPERRRKLEQACADLESLFIGNLLKAMKQTIPDSGLLPSSAGSKLYDSMMDSEVAVFLSQGQGLGLGRMIFQEMSARNFSNKNQAGQGPEEVGSLERRPEDCGQINRGSDQGLPLDVTGNKKPARDHDCIFFQRK